MKKITKTQLKQRDALSTDINDAHTGLETAINAYNDIIEKAKGDVEAALAEYNSKVEAARTFCEEIVSEMESYESDRSEKWADSDAGSAFADWKQEWENVELDDADLEFAEALEIPDNVHENLDALPEASS